MQTILLDMTPVFLEACICVAVGPFATVTHVRRPKPALVMSKVAQVFCDMVLLTTGTGEDGLGDMLQVIGETSGCITVRCCSAPTDIRTDWLACAFCVSYVGQMLVKTMATTTRASVLECQVYVH